MTNSKTTKASVTNFIYDGEKYLFIRRKSSLKVMPSQVNGIGGKLKKGEDYISAAIRETKEETGYEVEKSDIKFCGIIKFENTSESDWFTCFFKIRVPNRKIPKGKFNNEGNLTWFNQNEVLSGEHFWADDLKYIFRYIVSESKTFFLTAKVEDNHFKIFSISGNYLTNSIYE